MASLPELSDQQQQRLKFVCERFDAADRTVHLKARQIWEQRYREYRGFQAFKQYVSDIRGRDERVAAYQQEWGSALVIPYAYSTVETIVARMLSNSAGMLILPRDPTALENVESMRMTIEAQQEQIQYLLVNQTTAKTGQLYGLGVQKVGWRKETRDSYRLMPGEQYEWTAEPCQRVWDDPFVEDVDIFDFIWDPYADSLESAEWVIHRTWRSTEYVMSMLRKAQKAAAEGKPDGWFLAPDMTQEDVQALASGDKWTEVHKERFAARGLSAGGDPAVVGRHEVWEFHGYGKIVTVLNRQLPVAERGNPAWHGDFPFFVHRPTEVPHEFVGIGALEPSRDLFYEMNLTRSQRSDYNSLALTPVYAYQDGVIDPAILQVRPGALWPVLGEPRDMLQKVQLGDVPQSGYLEEDRIRADIERVTGLGDVVLGAASTGGTATEAQLQLASANVRIQNMTRRFEMEVIQGVCQMFVELNQQHIIAERGYTVQVPVQAPSPGQPDHRWSWFPVGPQMLAGAMMVKCLGGSEAKNVPQDRSDGQALYTMFGQDQSVDPQWLRQTVLEKMGVEHARSHVHSAPLLPPEMIPIAAQLLSQATKADPQLIEQVLQASVQMAEQQAQGPHPGQGPPQLPAPAQ